jgi:uncharacterized protein (TIGR02466 family)
MGIINLFPTPIYKDPASLENYDPVQIEIKKCLNYIKENDDLEDVSYIYKDAGKRKKEINYFISDQLIEHHLMKNLEKRIYETLHKYIIHTNWSGMSKDDPITQDNVNSKFKIMNSWINIAEKGVKHEYHSHPGYMIAGVYYFRVSSEQGGINFNNPNLMMYNCNFPEGNISPQSIELIPNDGDIILFPAWLQHGTHQNKSNEERISIAFNINYIL